MRLKISVVVVLFPSPLVQVSPFSTNIMLIGKAMYAVTHENVNIFNNVQLDTYFTLEAIRGYRIFAVSAPGNWNIYAHSGNKLR